MGVKAADPPDIRATELEIPLHMRIAHIMTGPPHVHRISRAIIYKSECAQTSARGAKWTRRCQSSSSHPHSAAGETVRSGLLSNVRTPDEDGYLIL